MALGSAPRHRSNSCALDYKDAVRYFKLFTFFLSLIKTCLITNTSSPGQMFLPRRLPQQNAV